MANFTVTATPQQITDNCKLGFGTLDIIYYAVGIEAPTTTTKWQTLEPFEPVNTSIWVKTLNGDVVVDKRDV